MSGKRSRIRRAQRNEMEKSASDRLEESRRGSKVWIAVATLAVMIMIGGMVYFLFFRTRNSTDHEEILPVSEAVEITEAQVSDGKVHFYSTESNGVSIKYMVVKDEDGVIRTAFDACDVCYEAKKGYTEVGEKVRCNNCGRTFPIDELGVTNQQGGCEPGYLPHTKTETGIRILTSDLENGKRYFV